MSELLYEANAFASYTEDSRGYLKPGYIADVIVVDNLFEMNVEEIREAKVDMTFIAGSRVK